MKKLTTKYPKLYDEIDPRLAEFFSQELIDVMPMLRSEGEDEDEQEDDDVSCPESDSRSIDSERGGVELDSARIAETGAGPSAGTTC